MPFPANRKPIRPARGTLAALTAEIAEIKEGEVVQPTDEESLYVKRGGVLVPMGAPPFDPADFATAAQGDLADTAVQPADIGTAAAEDVGAFATAAQGAKADTAVQPADLGTAAAEDVTAFATAAQGALAASAVQPGNPALSDAREWTASEVSQAEAEAGSSTTPRKWSALRVRQNVAAWWASLLEAGKIPASLLPGYVDDVIEVANFAALPVTGESGKIYVTLSDGKQHRWSGSAYITWEASPGTTDALVEGSLNLYFTTARALAAVTWGTLTGIPAWITSAASLGNQRILGRNTAGSGAPEALTLSQLLDWASNTQGALITRGSSGWVGLERPVDPSFLFHPSGPQDVTWLEETELVKAYSGLSSLGEFSSADLRDALNDEVGTGLAYFQNGDLGTPSAGSLTNCTGLPWAGVTGRAIRLCLAVSDETTALTAGTNKLRFRLPCAMTLSEVRASVNTAPTGSTLIVDINEAGATILSTKLSIDASETTSATAAAPAVISDASLANNAELSIDIDQVGAVVAGTGLKVWLIGQEA